MTFVLVIGALVLLVALLPFIAEALRTPMTRARQARATGEIAVLPGGTTHYRWTGPEKGQVAVCIHGLSTPSYIFAATERSLAALGYRVLSYDLYGRGYSSRKPGPQTADFFLGQLRYLLRRLDVAGPVTVLGYSMGGQIATAFAAEEKDRVSALILAAPTGLLPATNSLRHPAWLAPVVGDWLTRVAGGWALRRELVEHRNAATVIPDLGDRQAAETQTRGFLPALLSSRRYLLAFSATEDHKRIARAGIPVLALWGPEDPVVPLAAMGRLAELNPDARHEQIPGAGHNFLQTHPAQVAEALRRFLTP